VTPDQPCVDCLDHSLVAGHRRLAVPREAGFWLLAVVFTITMLGTTLPTPLYVIYQAQWHFSAAVVTVIFAVYAAGVLIALLLAGRSSDQAGRRPVLAVALGCSTLSTVGLRRGARAVDPARCPLPVRPGRHRHGPRARHDSREPIAGRHR
jgi:hypothetical protein